VCVHACSEQGNNLYEVTHQVQISSVIPWVSTIFSLVQSILELAQDFIDKVRSYNRHTHCKRVRFTLAIIRVVKITTFCLWSKGMADRNLPCSSAGSNLRDNGHILLTGRQTIWSIFFGIILLLCNFISCCYQSKLIFNK